jgi:hypothetical protein
MMSILAGDELAFSQAWITPIGRRRRHAEESTDLRI